ncbi:MAG: TatD family hydrolase [Nanoarchaeota archaeon]|nr:TatD family hydrolase [Nanoarchaeota archaeon]
MFFDIHCHLLDEAFNKDRAEVIKECGNKNIIIFETGLDYDSNTRVLNLASNYNNVFPCLGMHPTCSFDERVVHQLRSNKDNFLAVGEVGLDYLKDLNGQEEVFKKMIGVAEELGKPLIVHSRKAHLEVLEVVDKVKVPVILHSFSGSKKAFSKALELKQVFFSIPPSVVYSEQYQYLVSNTPINRLFCETDSPYLWKFERNTPLNVVKSYEKIAEIKGLRLSEAEKIIESNVRNVFKPCL